MSRQHLSDFEIGYNYVRKRYSFWAKYSVQYLWELGNAYLQTSGANAELSRGIGFYFLELGIKKRLTEIASAHKKEELYNARQTMWRLIIKFRSFRSVLTTRIYVCKVARTAC